MSSSAVDRKRLSNKNKRITWMSNLPYTERILGVFDNRWVFCFKFYKVRWGILLEHWASVRWNRNGNKEKEKSFTFKNGMRWGESSGCKPSLVCQVLRWYCPILCPYSTGNYTGNKTSRDCEIHIDTTRTGTMRLLCNGFLQVKDILILYQQMCQFAQLIPHN